MSESGAGTGGLVADGGSEERALGRDSPGRTLLFVGGLHRSGTSIVHRLLRSHPGVSGFADTGVPEDEGQYLQDVFPTAMVYGGPGRFAFDRRTHLTEESRLVSPRTRQRLLESWEHYWDLNKSVLVEKSPPNLIRSRFLSALFPEARFLFIVRHPIAVAMATRKWTDQSVDELVGHWAAAHGVLVEDLARLRGWACVRYEDFVAQPASTLDALFGFAGLPALPLAEAVESNKNAGYFREFEAEGGLRAPTDANVTRLLRTFGYTFEAPYYEAAPGSLGLLTSGLTGGIIGPDSMPPVIRAPLLPPRDAVANDLAEEEEAEMETWREALSVTAGSGTAGFRPAANAPDAARASPRAGRGGSRPIDNQVRLAVTQFMSSMSRGERAAMMRSVLMLAGLMIVAAIFEYFTYRWISRMLPPSYFLIEDVVSAIVGWGVIGYCGYKMLTWTNPNLPSGRRGSAVEKFDISLLGIGGLLLISPGTITTILGGLLLLRPARRLGAAGFARMVGSSR